MIDRDPLDIWRVAIQMPRDPQMLAAGQQQISADLDLLAAWLEQAEAGDKRSAMPTIGVRFGFCPPGSGDAARLVPLYWRVLAVGGTGRIAVEEDLLTLVAATLDPAHIPFWGPVLAVSRARDAFAERRRALAAAGLALPAVARADPAALAALRALMRHAHAQVRALAISYLGQAYRGDTPPALPTSAKPSAIVQALLAQLTLPSVEVSEPLALPPDLLDELRAVATSDPAFEPRFGARALLDAAGAALPLDQPDGTFTFKVNLRGSKRIYRVIELRAEQTLDDLHSAIQRAFRWDSDHLYAFFLNGRKYDQRYKFACPYEQDSPPWTDAAVIGALGLAPKHTFLYLFDYGDGHEFEVMVVGSSAQAGRGAYPRIVERKGEAPAQYWYEDDEQ